MVYRLMMCFRSTIHSQLRRLLGPALIVVMLSSFLPAFVTTAIGSQISEREFLFSSYLDGTGQERLANEISERLQEGYRVSPRRMTNSDTLIESVLADSSLAGLVRLDLYVDYLMRNPEAVGKVDLYGETPLCIFAATTTPEANVDDEEQPPAANDSLTTKNIDLGPRSDTDTLFILRAVWPEIEQLSEEKNSRFEFLGGYRAFDRVAKKETSAAVFLDTPASPSPRLRFIAKHPDLTVAGVPRTTSSAVAEAWGELGAKGYIPLTVSVRSGGWFPRYAKLRTVCTSLGVVVNNHLPDPADHQYVDAVVQMMNAGDVFVGSGTGDILQKARIFLNELTVFAMSQLEKGLGTLTDLRANYF
jgi:hypothetical protein